MRGISAWGPAAKTSSRDLCALKLGFRSRGTPGGISMWGVTWMRRTVVLVLSYIRVVVARTWTLPVVVVFQNSIKAHMFLFRCSSNFFNKDFFNDSFEKSIKRSFMEKRVKVFSLENLVSRTVLQMNVSDLTFKPLRWNSHRLRNILKPLIYVAIQISRSIIWHFTHGAIYLNCSLKNCIYVKVRKNSLFQDRVFQNLFLLLRWKYHIFHETGLKKKKNSIWDHLNCF